MSSSTNRLTSAPSVITSSGFRIRRATPTVTGFRAGVDAVVADRLAELDRLLGSRVFPHDHDTLREWISLPLTPRRATPAAGKWANGTLADKLRDQKVQDGDSTLGEVIDADAALATLRYGFEETLDDTLGEWDFNAQAVLRDHKSIRDLLVVRAYLLLGIKTQASLANYVRSHVRGVPEIVAYAVVSAARDHVYDKRLRVKDIDVDDGEAAIRLRNAGLSLSATSFADDAIETVTDLIESAKYDDLIATTHVDVDAIPDAIKLRLVEYIKTSVPPVTKENAPFIVPMYLARAATTVTTSSGFMTDDPFAVDYFVEDASSLQVSTAAVKCASQLYYVMVLGDELGVFDAVRHFTHRYLFREGFAVEDPKLRRDLETYVFGEEFPGVDTSTGEVRTMRTTRAGERRSFYRQVFDTGREPVPGDGMANTDFGRLWKILMLESARYLERAGASPHPDSYISRQNVMQATEDLQYNLSTACVGMATVITPLMYAELDFVVKNILGHAEVRKHLVPSGGSWWKVVEKLQANQGRRTRASVLHNKARIGYALIREIAEYTPSQFEQDNAFSGFISNVDAFITTQSILQEEADGSATSAPDEGWSDYGAASGSGTGGYGGYGDGRMPGMPDLSALPGMPAIPGVSAPWPGTAGKSGEPGASPVSPGAPDGAPGPGTEDWDF